ncbi:hypothetical protein ILUMI_16077 [Ignelater luminosus]|uniref:Uncharacterized protein n=1 Tax=Ignelater luminosus TaxID=2038154 RepID=A0A8K0CRW6_IGNLU|nr:hypothetical protein ILUMI_16077 [Ignelater luminosus]
MTWMNITENHVNGTEEQRRELENRTQEQSSYWLEEREKHLLASKFELVCRRLLCVSCKKTDDSTSMNLNIAAAAGCMSTGNGYSKMKELLPELMNILPMSSSRELQVQIGKPSL